MPLGQTNVTGDQLINQCASELDRDDLLIGGAKQQDAKDLLNDTIRHLFIRYNFTWRMESAPELVPVVVGQKDYDLSTQMTDPPQDIHTVIWDSGESDTRALIAKNTRTFLRFWANQDFVGKSLPTDYCRIGEKTMRIAPTPSRGVNFQVFFMKLFVNITNFTLALPISEKAVQVVKLGLLSRMYRWAHEWQEASGMINLAETNINQLIQEDKDDPDVVFRMQEAVFAARPFSMEFWTSPFIRRI